MANCRIGGRDHSHFARQFRSKLRRCSRSRESAFYRSGATQRPDLPRFGDYRTHRHRRVFQSGPTSCSKADNHKHRLATDPSHWQKAAEADHHKHQSPTEAKHSERVPGPRILLPRDLSGSAVLSSPPPMPQPKPPVLLAAASPTDSVQNAARPTVSSEAPDACPEPDVCIDQYLWSLYERTPKVDTPRETGQRNSTHPAKKIELRHPGPTRILRPNMS